MAVSPHWGPMPQPLGEPVAVPELRVGDDARAALADTRAALNRANGRIVAGRQFYDDTRSATGGRFGHN